MVSRYSRLEPWQLERRSQPWKWENTTGAVNNGDDESDGDGDESDDDESDDDDDDGDGDDDVGGDGDDIFTGHS